MCAFINGGHIRWWTVYFGQVILVQKVVIQLSECKLSIYIYNLYFQMKLVTYTYICKKKLVENNEVTIFV